MRLKWIIGCYLLTCGWCDEEVGFSPEPGLESRTAPFQSDYEHWTSLSERYPNSQVKAGFLMNPYSTRYSQQSHPLAQAPYPPPAAPYYAAREYGLPGLGYVITDPYSSTKYAPPVNTDQGNKEFSVSSEPAEEVPPEEEESSETTIPITTTTARPTKPPLPPPPPPPPPPLPPPFHSTNSINLSPPRQSHRLPKLPPKPHIYTQKGAHKKKPKKKLDKNGIEAEEYFINDDFTPREYIVEESLPGDAYETVNRVVLVRDPNSRQQYYYEFIIPSFATE